MNWFESLTRIAPIVVAYLLLAVVFCVAVEWMTRRTDHTDGWPYRFEPPFNMDTDQ